MNGFVDMIAQLGAMLLSLGLGLLMVWGSLVGFFRVLSAGQAERIKVLRSESRAQESNRATHEH